MTDATPPDLSEFAAAQARLEQLHSKQTEAAFPRISTGVAGLSPERSDALQKLASLDVTERALRDLLAEVRRQLSTDTGTVVGAGVSQRRIAEALGRSRTVLQGWLTPR